MNREAYNEAKVVVEEISRVLKENNLSEEDKQKLEISKAQLSGQLLSIWWPFDWTRRSIMITLFLVGLYGLIVGNTHFYGLGQFYYFFHHASSVNSAYLLAEFLEFYASNMHNPSIKRNV